MSSKEDLTKRLIEAIDKQDKFSQSILMTRLLQNITKDDIIKIQKQFAFKTKGEE